MKNIFLPIVVLLVSLFSISAFSQTDTDAKGLGLPGDGLDLYAVLEVFQKSKTIEDFEKTLNDDNSKINNLDLDNDKKVDFIKVVTNKDGDNFSFVLQVPINKSETQDVAVILVSRDKSNNVSIQIVGDEELYGKDYVIEPSGNKENNTPNPGYSGSKVGEKVISEAPTPTPTPTTVVVVQSAPIVQYVYSPMYVPYFPPYYYGYYPPYFHPWYPLTFGIYWSNHFYCHGGYYGGYRGNVNININNFNHYNNYNNNYRNRSITVNNYNRNGIYRNNGNVSSRPSNRSSRNVSSNRASMNNNASASNKASTSLSSKRASNKSSSASNRASSSSSSSNSGGKLSPRSIKSYGGGRR